MFSDYGVGEYMPLGSDPTENQAEMSRAPGLKRRGAIRRAPTFPSSESGREIGLKRSNAVRRPATSERMNTISEQKTPSRKDSVLSSTKSSSSTRGRYYNTAEKSSTAASDDRRPSQIHWSPSTFDPPRGRPSKFTEHLEIDELSPLDRVVANLQVEKKGARAKFKAMASKVSDASGFIRR